MYDCVPSRSSVWPGLGCGASNRTGRAALRLGKGKGMAGVFGPSSGYLPSKWTAEVSNICYQGPIIHTIALDQMTTCAEWNKSCLRLERARSRDRMVIAQTLISYPGTRSGGTCNVNAASSPSVLTEWGLQADDLGASVNQRRCTTVYRSVTEPFSRLGVPS
ncbi:hypothetical protein VTK56DRAFT_323 [Thermocarpiscus australiensis]